MRHPLGSFASWRKMYNYSETNHSHTDGGKYQIICDMLFSSPLDIMTGNISDIGNGTNLSSHHGAYHHSNATQFAGSLDLSIFSNYTLPPYLIPFRILTIVICGIGLIGNILNITIFLKRAPLIKPNSIEKPANIGFLALSICDLLFCSLAMMKNLLPPNQLVYESPNLSLYFALYILPFLDILFNISGWLTVTLAMTRYLAVCHPIKTRQYFNVRQIYIAIFSSIFIWIVLMIPLFFLFRLEYIQCNKQQLIVLDFGAFETNTSLHNGFEWVWTILGFLVPVGILMFCNTSLTMAFKQSARVQSHHRQPTRMSHKNRKITLTLIVVVVMFILFVTPSKIIPLVIYLSDDAEAWSLKLAFEICNILLVANSCVNFFVYMTINVYYRHTLLSCFFPKCSRPIKLSRFYSEFQSLTGSYRGGSYKGASTREKPLSSISSGRVIQNLQ